MENSEKDQKIDAAEEGMVKKEVVEEVSKTQTEIPDGKTETDRDVDVEGFDVTEVESETNTGEIAAAEEVIETKGEFMTTSTGAAEEGIHETKEEVVTTSDGTVVEEEAEKVPKEANDAAAEKTEEVVDSVPKKLDEGALPNLGTNVEESSDVNLTTNGSAGNAERSEVPRGNDNQTFAAATPRTRTTWTNCCGLLELLKRSIQ